MRPRFVNEKRNIDFSKEKTEKDNFGIVETKEPEVVKPKDPEPIAPPAKKDKWVDGVTTTLVNFRSTSDKDSQIIDMIRGGELIKFSSSLIYGDFFKVEYKGKIGYVNKNYVRKVYRK